MVCLTSCVALTNPALAEISSDRDARACRQDLSLDQLIKRQRVLAARATFFGHVLNFFDLDGFGADQRRPPDLLAPYLAAQTQLPPPDVQRLVDAFPGRRAEINLRRDKLLMDELLRRPHLDGHQVGEVLPAFSPRGLNVFLGRLIERDPALAASNGSQLVERASRATNSREIAQAYLNAVGLRVDSEHFRALVMAAQLPPERTADFINAYLRGPFGDTVKEPFKRLRLLELLTDGDTLDPRAADILAQLWAQGLKPADLAERVSALTHRLSQHHYLLDQGPRLDIAEVLPLAEIVGRFRVPTLVNEVLARRDHGLVQEELEALAEAPGWGLSFLQSPMVLRLLSEWSTEDLVEWIATSPVLETRTNRRHLFLEVITERFARGHSLPFDEKRVIGLLIQIAGQDRFALTAINGYARATEADPARRWRLKLRLTLGVLEPGYWNGALALLVKEEGANLRPQDIGEILEALFEPAADEIDLMIANYRLLRPGVPLTAMVERQFVPPLRAQLLKLDDAASVGLWIKDLPDDLDADRALDLYHRNIKMEAAQDSQRRALEMRHAPNERDRDRLAHLRLLVDQSASVRLIAPALSAIQHQALALATLERYLDRNQLDEKELVALLHALEMGRTKLALFRMYLLAQYRPEWTALAQIPPQLSSEVKHDAGVLLSRVSHAQIPSALDELTATLANLGGDAARLDIAEYALNHFGTAWTPREVAQLGESFHSTPSRLQFARRYVHRQINANNARVDEFGAYLNALGDDVLEGVAQLLVDLGHHDPATLERLRNEITKPWVRELLRAGKTAFAK